MNLFSSITRSLREYKRIISISKKPNKKEFINILKVCGMGIVVIGVIGFVIQLLYTLLMSV